MRTNKYLEAIQQYISAKDMSYCNCGKNQVPGFSCRQHCKYGKGENTEALQYGKPGPNDPRKTPAPKKDQKKGSKKNKPDSAKDDKGKISLDESIIKRLQALVAEHNKKIKAARLLLVC
jgi:hypothetical protein